MSLGGGERNVSEGILRMAPWSSSTLGFGQGLRVTVWLKLPSEDTRIQI